MQIGVAFDAGKGLGEGTEFAFTTVGFTCVCRFDDDNQGRYVCSFYDLAVIK